MKYVKIAVMFFGLFNVFTSYVQAEIPAELIGKWKIVNAYAADASLVVDDAESAALLDDLVVNNLVEYSFTETQFALFVNSELVGTCNYTFVDETSQFIFDQDGAYFEDIVKNLVGFNLTETELHLMASPPDGDSPLTFYEFLVKQP
jgi:hypothetical protein